MKTMSNSEVRALLMELTGAHWVAVGFHKEKPRGMKVSAPEAFCSAAAGAITVSSLLKVSDIPCGGLKYAFNFPGAKTPVLGSFIPGRLHPLINPQAAVGGKPRLAFSPQYLSFNAPDSRADLYLSFMLLESASEMAQVWSSVSGKKLNCKFNGVMSFCSEGAAEAMNSRTPTLALGCSKAIRTAGLQGQVCVCLPEKDALKLAAAWARKSAAGAVA
ncbi:MAG: hypothetical protein COT18_06790 [Elusimicrobia bacterium CG08_land_8_20_14_0_20_59_10]|nr:MAG: hypothetical protein COT18_06790 [Elusimicrobia bacterium CG08_land_8_20_14_0_20_59_10]